MYDLVNQAAGAETVKCCAGQRKKKLKGQDISLRSNRVCAIIPVSLTATNRGLQ